MALLAAQKASAIATMVFKNEVPPITTEKIIELSTKDMGLRQQFREEVEKLRRKKSGQLTPFQEFYEILNPPKISRSQPVQKAKISHKYVTYLYLWLILTKTFSVFF